MRLHRFIGDFQVENNREIKITDPKIIKQIRSVLRLKKGEKLILSDGKGEEYEGAIKVMEPKEIICEIISARTTLAELAGKQVNLYLAILKKENFELAVEKAVECGVSSITPVITERTIKTGLNIPRLEKIILEASEQSGRSVVPTLSPILNFKDALDTASKSEEKIIFHLVDNPYLPRKNTEVKPMYTSIFIGPEGGFTEREIELAKDAGFSVASLGSLTLRGETAAIVATYRAMQAV